MQEEKDFQSGARIDLRPEEEKAKDYKFEEIVASAEPVNWTEKPEKEWRAFPIFNQDGSGSCVAQTAAKLLGILYWLKNNVYVHFSATHIYQRRSNKPQGGMIGTNCMDIMREGTTLEALVPSQSMSDTQMDAVLIEKYKEDVGKIFKIKNYVVLPIRDIETVASVIQKTGKGVMTWFFFLHPEWGQDVPAIQNANLTANDASRHSVASVDFTLYKGKKAVIIEDSWGPGTGKGGRRVITEDFFKTRNFFVAYPINFVFEEGEESTKPKYTFTKTLKYSAVVSYDKEVEALQKCLKYLGLFPTNADATGYFGSLTKKAVIAFQEENKLKGDGIVGPVTRGKLNALFN